VCSKKLTLAGAFACACSGQFCAAHRHAEQHACTHDFKTEQRAVLTKQNPVVIADKLEKV
jgi:predicted nucleic acid binding AN1-type Zn finger protein